MPSSAIKDMSKICDVKKRFINKFEYLVTWPDYTLIQKLKQREDEQQSQFPENAHRSGFPERFAATRRPKAMLLAVDVMKVTCGGFAIRRISRCISLFIANQA